MQAISVTNWHKRLRNACIKSVDVLIFGFACYLIQRTWKIDVEAILLSLHVMQMHASKIISNSFCTMIKMSIRMQNIAE